jgi:hypothetical protein
MKAAIEAVRNKEMGSCKASRIFNATQTTLQRYIKDRKKSPNEAIKTKLGRKQVLPREEENYMAKNCLLMEIKF